MTTFKSEQFQEWGRKGGIVKSPKKAASCKKNGFKVGHKWFKKKKAP